MTASMARWRAAGLDGSPDRSMAEAAARMPAGSAACICAVVGWLSTSVTYRVRQVVHWTCSPTEFSGMTGRKNSVNQRRPARCRYCRSPPQRRQWKVPCAIVR